MVRHALVALEYGPRHDSSWSVRRMNQPFAFFSTVDKAALVSAFVYRATPAQLRIVLFECDTKELQDLLD